MSTNYYKPAPKSFLAWLLGDLWWLAVPAGLTYLFYQPYILIFDGTMIAVFLYFFWHTVWIHLTILRLDEYVISADSPFFNHLTLGWSEVEEIGLYQKKFLFFRPARFLILRAGTKSLTCITSTLSTEDEERLLANVHIRLKTLSKKERLKLLGEE